MEMYHCRSQNDRQVDERMQFTDLYTDNERKSRSVSAVKAKSRRLSVTGKHLWNCNEMNRYVSSSWENARVLDVSIQHTETTNATVNGKMGSIGLAYFAKARYFT